MLLPFPLHFVLHANYRSAPFVFALNVDFNRCSRPGDYITYRPLPLSLSIPRRTISKQSPLPVRCRHDPILMCISPTRTPSSPYVQGLDILPRPFPGVLVAPFPYEYVFRVCHPETRGGGGSYCYPRH